MSGEKVGLREREWHIATTLKRGVDTSLAHRLAMNRTELTMPALTEPGYPVAILKVECAHRNAVTAVEFL